MVVPAVRVVVRDHDRRRLPVAALLDGGDDLDDERLLVDGIGVARVPVLVGRRLQVADGGEVAALQRVEEVVAVVLVVGGVGGLPVVLERVADRGHAAGAQVVRVRGARVVLEGLVVRDVVGRRVRAVGDGLVGLSRAARGAVGVRDRQIEAALEPSPADALGVEQVADVLARHRRLVRGGRADVADRIGVADDREAPVSVGDGVARRQGRVVGRRQTVGLPGDEVDGARS